MVVQYPTSKHDIEDMRPDDNRVVEDSASSIIAVSYEARPSGVRLQLKNGVRNVCFETDAYQVRPLVHMYACSPLSPSRRDAHGCSWHDTQHTREYSTSLSAPESARRE